MIPKMPLNSAILYCVFFPCVFFSWSCLHTVQCLHVHDFHLVYFSSKPFASTLHYINESGEYFTFIIKTLAVYFNCMEFIRAKIPKALLKIM